MTISPEEDRPPVAARLLLRNAYARCLDPIPDSYLLALRTAYLNARPGSRWRQLLFRALNCVRYKHPDTSVHSFAIADEPSVRLLNVDSIIVRHVYWLGLYGPAWEGTEIRAWQYFCGRASKILEIGANIGVYTLCGAARAACGKYTAVEPHPFTSDVLRCNLALNRLGTVRVIEAAVVGQKTSDRMTLMTPNADQDKTPSGSFLDGAGELSSRASRSCEVNVTAIQDLIEGVDLLKLDVEGYEYDILNGARDVLLEQRPTLFVEVLPQAHKLQRFLADLSRQGAFQLFAAGRTIQRVDPRDLIAGRLQQKYRTRDVFMVPAERPVSANEILQDGPRASPPHTPWSYPGTSPA
jgi:FkbM family methyltransferase